MKSKISLPELKQQAFTYCTEFVWDRINRLQQQIKEVVHALTSETKSSAGDKHETGRAMLQLEREKLGAQLAEAEQMQALLKKALSAKPHKTIGLGSLVITNKASYFIAISAGQFTNKQKSFFCISPSTPIGKLLLGKQIGDTFQFNQNTSTILHIG